MDPEIKSKKIETLSGDMSRVMQNPEQGMIRQIIEDQQEHEEDKKIFSPESSRNKKFIAISVTLFILAFGLLFLFFFKKDAFTLFVAPRFTPIIFTDNTDYIPIDDLSKDKTIELIYSRVKATNVKESGVESLYLTENKKVIGLRVFMERIKSTLDLSNSNAIKDNFLLGVVNRDSEDLFILMQTNSFRDAFGTILSWENRIFSDLHGFFGINITPETGYLLTKDFENGVIQNKNAQILYDNDGKIVLAVVYVDDDSILITNTEQVAKEIILRLSSSKVRK